MLIRLPFPSGGACFPCILHSHLEASSSSLRGPSSPEWASARASSEGWVIQQCATRHCQMPLLLLSWSSLQSGSGRVPEAILLLGKKKKNTKTEIAALCPLAGLIHTAALTLSLQRAVLFPVWLKISKFRFIMTGADKFAGEMRAVSPACWEACSDKLIWGERWANTAETHRATSPGMRSKVSMFSLPSKSPVFIQSRQESAKITKENRDHLIKGRAWQTAKPYRLTDSRVGPWQEKYYQSLGLQMVIEKISNLLCTAAAPHTHPFVKQLANSYYVCSNQLRSMNFGNECWHHFLILPYPNFELVPKV